MGTLALTACTKDDVVEEGPQSNAIRFENIINKTTRSEVTGDVDLEHFDLFSVYAYYTLNGETVGVFNGDLVSKKLKTPEDGSDPFSIWDYTDTRYWMPNATYYFYAYSCADVALAQDEEGNYTKGTPFFDYTAKDDNPLTQTSKRGLKIVDYLCNATHQHDLICAFTEGIIGKNSGNTNVKFTFKHALCKVSAEFVNDLPKGYDIEVSDVSLSNFYSTATYDIRSNSWSGQARNNTLTESIAMPLTGATKATSTLEHGESAVKVPTSSVFMLPVYYDNPNLIITFTLTVKQGNGELLKRTIQGSWQPVWAPGHAYKYAIHLTGDALKLEPIVFEATQSLDDNSNWQDEQLTDITFGLVN